MATTSTRTDEQPGAWTQLLRGIRYDYGAGRIIGDLRVGDLAHSLAGINRYNAWTPVYWPVALHACLVSETLAAMAVYDLSTVLLGLHHDDHEAMVGDVIQPFKQAMSEVMRGELRFHARRADWAIWRALGIWSLVQASDTAERKAAVKAADIAALEAERRWLMVPRLTWETEAIVDPKVLEVAERILANDLSRIQGGQPAAERFCRDHNALVEKLGAA